MPDRLVPELISKIETPDDRTIVIHWNDLYNEAYAIQYTHVRAFPRHLLLDAFSARRYEGVRQSAVTGTRTSSAPALIEWSSGTPVPAWSSKRSRIFPWGGRRSSA